MTNKRKTPRTYFKPNFRAEVRRAVADYMQSEGCGCCRDTEAHNKHAATLAKLLGVPKYDDSSGFDFPRFRTAK